LAGYPDISPQRITITPRPLDPIRMNLSLSIQKDGTYPQPYEDFFILSKCRLVGSRHRDAFLGKMRQV
jgi:hypothetical protein